MNASLPLPADVTRYRIPADAELVGPLRDQFATALSAANISEAEVRSWLLTFNELVFNAIRHGASGVPNAEVTIEWCFEEDVIRLATEDPGPGPPDSMLRNPTLPDDPLAESGRGLFLLHNFADELRPFRGHKGFRFEVMKRYPGMGRVMDLEPEMERALEELSICYESLSIFYRLAQNLQESSGLGAFISGALGDFVRMHPFQRVFLLGSVDMPATVFDALKKEPWFLNSEDAGRSMQAFAALKQECVWENPEELERRGIDPGALRHPSAGCAIPVNAGDMHFGSLVALRKSEGNSLNSGSLGILRTLSDLCGIACANSHLGQLRDQSQKKLGELEIAVEIQKSLLPILSPPVSSKWKIRIDHESSLQVAGDYAMAKTDSKGNLVTAIIDVMGKGVSAALLASIFRTTFELCLDRGTSAELLEAINAHLCSQLGDLTMFITCAIARVDAAGKTMDFSSAGHCRTLLYGKDGGRQLLEPSGPPLGLIPDMTYASETIPLRGGERMIFLTDGCYEWDRTTGAEAGWQRFLELADAYRGRPAGDFWVELMHRIHTASGPTPEDDCTLLTLDILP
ncbi:MAG: phosphoserine phosphatase RsbU/P [Akkermansiaceae bacterium]|nr:phosphoserine phosphatase RsbU/P [Akkermansiaceae bacterium]